MYILQCSDDSYYVGSTVNLEQREWQHQQGEGAKYTARRLPVELVYTEEYPRIDEAYQRENQVKGWSRAKKGALIRGDFDALPGLSSSQLESELSSSYLLMMIVLLQLIEASLPRRLSLSKPGEKAYEYIVLDNRST